MVLVQLLCIERPSSLPEFIKPANLIIPSRSREKIQHVSAPCKYHQPFGGNRPASTVGLILFQGVIFLPEVSNKGCPQNFTLKLISRMCRASERWLLTRIHR